MKLITTHLFGLLCFLFAIKSAGENSKTINGEDRNIYLTTSFNVSSGASVCIPENLYVLQSGRFWNDGFVSFSNKLASESYFPGGNLGMGEFSFEGESDFVLNIESDFAEIGSLNLNSRKSLILSGDLKVSFGLNLKRGLLRINDSNYLLIKNVAANSIQFDNSPINRCYVTGRLGRTIIPSETYYFPVGNHKGFHPLYITDAKESGTLFVNFDDNIPGQWSSVGTDKSIAMVPEIGWNIESVSQETNEFFTGLSLFDNNSEMITGNLRMFYSSGWDMLNPVIDWNVKQTDNFYLRGPAKRTTGIYALVQDEILRLPNFFLTGTAGSSQFEIPEASQYSKIELTVFNRLGNQIFKSNRYLNEMDTKDYPSGTYFYELVLYKGNDKEMIRNFIEIRHEK